MRAAVGARLVAPFLASTLPTDRFGPRKGPHTHPMADQSVPRSFLGPAAVRLAALWILTGALFKLFVGTPNDLPLVVKDFAASLGMSATLVFRLAIAIEISVAVPALLRPRLVWPLVAAQLAIFCAILVPLALAGEASCGCFGSKVAIPPWVMFAIDATLLALVLATRPWRGQRARRALLVPIGASLIAAWVLPFVLVPSGVAAVSADGSRPYTGRFVDWDPVAWVGKPLRETGLAAFVAVDDYPQDASWVLYNPTCEHCAAVLRRLAGEFEQEPKLYVLVQLPAVKDAPQQVDLKPPGEEVLLPTETEYVVTPPWVLEVVGGVVQSADHSME